MGHWGKKVVLMVLAGLLAPGLVVLVWAMESTSSEAQEDAVASSEWTVVVDGLVQSPLSLTVDDLVAMPTTTVYAPLYCVGLPTTPLAEGNWTGVRLALILEEAGVSPEAVKVAFYAVDGFATDLTLTTAMRDDVLLAYERDGEPLTENLRLVIPCKWGYKWIRDLTQIELVNYDFLGTYESAGYSDEADILGDVDCDGVADDDDNCESVVNPGQEDFDSDDIGDQCDDSDMDAFTDYVELFVGTDSLDDCPDLIGTPGFCPGPSCDGHDAWSPDVDVNAWVNIADVYKYKGKLGKNTGDPDYVQRLDLNADGGVNMTDVYLYKGILGKRCANP